MAVLDPEFAEKFIAAMNDGTIYPIAPLVGLFWKYAPADVLEKYLADFESKPEQRRFCEEMYFPQAYDFDALGALPKGTLGNTFHQHVLDNNLNLDLATGKMARDVMAKERKDDGLPEKFRYLGHRISQTHDLQHVVTGYPTSGVGEIALQAFDLAQVRYAYHAAWISTIATRMTFMDPNMINPLMDAIAEGWSFGRAVRNIQFEKWETMFERPLAEVRREYGIAPQGRRPLSTPN